MTKEQRQISILDVKVDEVVFALEQMEHDKMRFLGNYHEAATLENKKELFTKWMKSIISSSKDLEDLYELFQDEEAS